MLLAGAQRQTRMFYDVLKQSLETPHIHPHRGKYFFGRQQLLLRTAVVINCMSGRICYSSLRGESLLTLAAGIINHINCQRQKLNNVA